MSQPMSQFPSIKANRLLTILERKPLSYRIVRQSGSHRRLEAPGRPSFSFAFHDKANSAKLTSPSNWVAVDD